MPNRIIYCWDTSVLTAWIKGEDTAPLGDIGLIVDEIDTGKAALLISVTTITEMLEGKFTSEQWSQLEQFQKRSNIIMANVTPQLAYNASIIRNNALADGRKLRTPDAQIIATAIFYKAIALHSLDPHQLNLNGTNIVDGLCIIKPISCSGSKWLNGLD